MEEEKEKQKNTNDYTEEHIVHLDDMEHVRARAGMYIGRLGDGSHAEDGIYVLLKETIDNSIDEFNEGFGKRIDVDITDQRARLRARHTTRQTRGRRVATQHRR